MAREEVKQIFGRETIKLHDAKGEVVPTWGPVAAFFDWSVRPEFWNDQPIILVDYLPLKRLLLAGTIEERLGAIAAKETTSPADRDAAKALMADRALSAAALSKFARQAKLSAEDRTEIDRLAEPAGRGPPLDVRARARGSRRDGGGPEGPLRAVVPGGGEQGQQAENDPSGATKLTDVEKRADRGRHATGPFPDPSRPRDSVPSNPCWSCPGPINPSIPGLHGRDGEEGTRAGAGGRAGPAAHGARCAEGAEHVLERPPGRRPQGPGRSTPSSTPSSPSGCRRSRGGSRSGSSSTPSPSSWSGPVTRADRSRPSSTPSGPWKRPRRRRPAPCPRRPRLASSPRPTTWARRSTRSRTRRRRRWPARRITTRRTRSGTRSTLTAWR